MTVAGGYMEAIINFEKIEEQIRDGIETAYISRHYSKTSPIKPRFIYNHKTKGETVLATIREELSSCQTFWFSVAFVTQSGLSALKTILLDLAKEGIKGKILTSNFLTFNDPKAFYELLKLENVEVKVFDGELHTKGYCFSHKGYQTLLVGSANLTAQALQQNEEWNLKVSSLEDGEIVASVQDQFDRVWSQAITLTPQWIEEYTRFYIPRKRILNEAKIIPLNGAKLQPNAMQNRALASLEALREKGEEKALLISATGTGKTYLSAFDVRAVNPKRMLFVAHREQLLSQAKASYEQVLGNTKTYGILGGGHRYDGEDYVFATVQTLSREDQLKQFSPTDFDYIIIDEVHRAGAESYAKLFDYFSPDFCLGMTATPERTDGADIFKLFDNNIACEIRLQQALEANLLCDFHYYGIADISIDGKLLDEEADFSVLTSEERVRHIIDNATYYGYSGDRVRGLVFCRSVEEAAQLAKVFSAKGYRAVDLNGSHSNTYRHEAIARLEADSKEMDEDKVLDYIFTVDIFNEGVDIPSVNQIIMLRPTQSAIIFVQQLGRGLRKFRRKSSKGEGLYDEKEFVVIIDFIGNYNRSYLIPMALTGDRSYNKDNVRRGTAEGERLLPGVSTINFDRIAKQKIYESIDQSMKSSLALLKESYNGLKSKLGKIPSLQDFEEYGSIDPINFFKVNSVGTYYKFLEKYEKEFTGRLSDAEENALQFVCKVLGEGKRRAELEILYALLDNAIISYHGQELLLNQLEKVLSNRYLAKAADSKRFYGADFVTREGEIFCRTTHFEGLLKNPTFKESLEEVLLFALARNAKFYTNPSDNIDLVVGMKYTYEESFKGLRWQENQIAQNVGGYKYDQGTNTFAVYINYHKSEEIADSIKYEDEFLDQEHLLAFSKSNRSLESPEIVRLKEIETNKTKVYLFVRKNKDDNESKEFYFLGEMKPIQEYEEVLMPSNHKAVKIYYRLQHAVPKDLYDYITMEQI